MLTKKGDHPCWIQPAGADAHRGQVLHRRHREALPAVDARQFHRQGPRATQYLRLSRVETEYAMILRQRIWLRKCPNSATFRGKHQSLELG